MKHLDTNEISFQKILALCDIAGRMARGVDDVADEYQKELLEIITPVIKRVDVAVKRLTDLYVAHLNDDEQSDQERSHAVDMAIKEVYEALSEMKDKGLLLVEHMKEVAPHD